MKSLGQKIIYGGATWFGCGRLPKMPGTWGTLGALPFAIFLNELFTPTAYVLITLAVFGVGWLLCIYITKKDTAQKDPAYIVIDEVVGMWIAVFGLTSTHFSFEKLTVLYAVGFALFRIFDIWKPWPVSWADQLEGPATVVGFGIMMDDVLAGIYSFFFLNILILFWV